MTTVRGVTVAGDRRGWTPSVDDRMSRLETPLRRLLDPRASSLAGAEAITIVPDVHYPFHPSTGMITDPAVVGALVAVLERETTADVAVAASGEHVAADRTVDYLGYDDLLDRFDASVVDATNAQRRSETLRVGDQPVALGVPDRLAESTVVPVPSVRPTRDGPVAGAARTLARCVDSSVDGGVGAAAAATAVDPAFGVLDATTVYAGESYAADALLAGPVPPIDAVAARLLDRSPADDEAIAPRLRTDPDEISVDGLDLASLADRCPAGDLPPPTDPHPAVSFAYRTYAAVSGDAVPPQLDGD